MKRMDTLLVSLGFVGFLYIVNHSLTYFLNSIKSETDTVLTLEPIPECNEHQEEHLDSEQEEERPESGDQEEHQHQENKEEHQEEDVFYDSKDDIVNDLLQKKKYLLDLQNQLTSIKATLDAIQNDL